ncbi:MAG: PPC domain-containing protein [Opitutaceae bacterium]|nr:PPC domain-containing protein [Opitutaceae bacterium]
MVTPIRRPVAPAFLRQGRAWLATLFLSCAAAAEKTATPAAPTLTHLFPVAAVRGTATPVTAVGKFDPWPPSVWTDTPGISFLPGEKAGQFTVDVSPDVPPGPHLVRFFNATGASAPRFLIVATGPEAAEAEPNDEYGKPQVVEHLPVTVNGRLNKSGDVDSFGVRLEAGQTLRASLDAYVLGSPVDAVLRLVDTRGLELALNHDNGRTFDPALAWTAATAGTYVLQVFGFAQPATADVRFTGSDACVYRLHLALGPGPEPAFSPTESPAWTETEHMARTADEAAPTAPFAVTGVIAQVGEKDRYAFSASKGEKLVFAIQSAALGLPLDAWLAIQNAAGKELVRNDDGPNADPFLEWTAPETGRFVAVVGSVLQRAGPEYRYRLSVQPPQPRFQGVIAESGFAVEPGKPAKIKVTARRLQGFKSKLTANVIGLPEGVSANPVEIGETEKEITLEVSATPEAPPYRGPIRIEFRAENSDQVHPAIHELISSTSRNGVPQGFRDLVITATDKLWLTVTPGTATAASSASPSGTDNR